MKNSHISFKTSQTNTTLTSYAKTMMFPIALPNNATRNTTGIDIMDHILGRSPFVKLGSFLLHLVGEEIIHRGGEVYPKMRVRQLGKRLLKMELERQRQTYKERTNEDSKYDYLKSNTFKPHRVIADYYELLLKK